MMMMILGSIEIVLLAVILLAVMEIFAYMKSSPITLSVKDYEVKFRPPQHYVDWTLIPTRYRWVAMDENGEIWGYSGEAPKIDEGDNYWSINLNTDHIQMGDNVTNSSAILFTPMNWRTSLIERPEGM
jgi:hypothetical protein